MWQNISSSFCSAGFLNATLMCQGIPHVGHGVPGVVVRPHFIHVLGEIANGLIEAASGTCICSDVRSHPQITYLSCVFEYGNRK